MTAVSTWVRAVLRQRWRATVVLSLLIGIAGAAALGAADGARRTQTAFPRMRQTSRAADLLVSVGGSGLGGFYDALGALPGVESIGKIAGIPLVPLDKKGRPDLNSSPLPNAAVDDHTMISIQRPKIIAGRAPNPAASDEALVDPLGARLLQVHVGSVVPMFLFKTEKLKDGVRISLRIVGVGIQPESVVPTTPLDAQPTIVVTPAFFNSQPSLTSRQNLNYDGAFVRLQPRGDIQAFEDAADALVKKYPETLGGTFFQDLAQTGEREQRAIMPLAIAVYVFAGLIAVAILFVLGQAIARQQFVEGDDYGTLRALGFTRTQVVVVGLIRVGLIATIGAVLAALGALAVSPFMPIGPARLAEPSPGFEANVAIIALGAVGLVVLLLARAALPALRLASGRGTEGPATRRSVLAEGAARAGMAPPAAAGIRMAFEQHHGKRSLPLRGALAGSIVGLAALTAALMFGSSLNRLVTVPAAYGQRWTVIADSSFGTVHLKEHAAEINADPGISGYTGGNYGAVTIGGRDVPAIGLDRIKGNVYPALLEGRPAEKPNEIVIGTLVMRRLRTSVGRTIPVTLPLETQPRSMTVVGRAVFPTLGRGSFTPTSLGDGAAMVAANFTAYEKTINPDAPEPYNFLLFRIRGGADEPAAEKRLRDLFVDPQCAQTNDCSVVSQQRPIELGVLTRVRSVPLILAGLLALFAAATLAHALLTSVRLRARDLAILKTIGFIRRQIIATVAWQTSTLAVTALLLGLPLGIIAGRAIWSMFASGLGVPSVPVISAVVLGVAIPSTLLLANVIGALPARAAARTEAAVVLRTE